MSSIFERIGRLRRQLGERESISWREQLRTLREDLEQTQRLLLDATVHGSFEHSRQLALWYARLELPVGTTSKEVTRSFRRLVRLYHPDLYAADPAYAELANELTQHLVVAYNGLLQHLGATE